MIRAPTKPTSPRRTVKNFRGSGDQTFRGGKARWADDSLGGRHVSKTTAGSHGTSKGRDAGASRPYRLVAKASLLEYALRRETHSASESTRSNCGNLCRCRIVLCHTLVGLESVG